MTIRDQNHEPPLSSTLFKQRHKMRSIRDKSVSLYFNNQKKKYFLYKYVQKVRTKSTNTQKGKINSR